MPKRVDSEHKALQYIANNGDEGVLVLGVLEDLSMKNITASQNGMSGIYVQEVYGDATLKDIVANMNTEAWLGFNAFNTSDLTGQRTIDFIKYRQLVAQGHPFDDELADAVIAKPKE